MQGKVEPGEAVSFFQETEPLHQKLREKGYAGLQTFSLIVEDSLSNRYRGDFKIDVGSYCGDAIPGTFYMVTRLRTIVTIDAIDTVLLWYPFLYGIKDRRGRSDR